MQPVLCDKAPRVHLGRIASPGPSSGYVMRIGEAGSPAAADVAQAASMLERYKLKPEQSPLADDNGAVRKLAAEVLRGSPPGDLAGAVERVIDMRPFLGAEIEGMFPREHPSVDLRFEAGYLAPDVPPIAGLLLGERRRFAFDSVSKSRFLIISNVMESYMLATAVLREAGFRAYPATAVLPAEDGEAHKPLVAVMGEPCPLVTFDLLRRHPPLGAVELISDEALWGVSHVLRAQNRVKSIVSTISMRGLQGGEVGPEELRDMLESVAEALFECHKVWPGSHFIGEAIMFLGGEFYDTFSHLAVSRIRAGWEEFASGNPELAANPQLLEMEMRRWCETDAANAQEVVLDSLAGMMRGSNPAGVPN